MDNHSESAFSDNKDDSNDYPKLTPVDLYRELWEGRNFELSSLWQRSIFLTIFLVLLFTGYALVWNLLLSDMDSARTMQLIQSGSYQFQQFIIKTPAKSIVSYLLLHIIFLFITILGVVFSLLWIYMAKGSKYWYEKYENSINDILDTPANLKLVFNKDLQDAFNKKDLDGSKQFPRHGNLVMPEKDKFSDCVFSPKAGAYSVSKVNVLIGQLALIIWGILYVGHFMFLSIDATIALPNKLILLFCSLMLLLLLIVFTFIKSKSEDGGNPIKETNCCLSKRIKTVPVSSGGTIVESGSVSATDKKNKD